MGNVFKKVRDGDKLRIPASTYNAMIDAAQDYANRKSSVNTNTPQALSANIVFIKNTTGALVDRFGILGISNTELDVNSNSFKESVCFTGVSPSTASHSGGRFVVTCEPIAAGAIGRAYAAGFVVVKINVIDEAHTCADIETDDKAKLKSAESGAAVILWKESGTGDKWGIIRFGGGSAGGGDNTLWVILSKVPDEPNVDAGELTVEYAGNNTYEGRIYGKTYKPWNPTDEPYLKGEIIYYEPNNTTYKVTAEPAVTNMELSPPENTAEYLEFPEILIEHVEQNESILLKETFPIFQVGDIVRVVSRAVEGEVKYFLAHTLSNRGETETTNIMSITDASGKSVVKVVY
ncbi:MAG: hypothetical protein A2Y12_01395 [Planctomycetes bacterium GWF2_42_9]|nr:MAG: hypothetical protein A2Y12_01395 [Planctomycetes bacterium GWF2_42_9]